MITLENALENTKRFIVKMKGLFYSQYTFHLVALETTLLNTLIEELDFP